jgi:predicted GH43/DUF377 family glycosyl hydrolase
VELEIAIDMNEKLGEKALAVMGSVNGPLTIAWSPLGYEQICLMLYDDPGFLAELAEIGVDFAVKITARIAATGVDAMIIADDYGSSSQGLLKPQHFKAIYKPALKKMVDRIKSYNLPVFLYSSGQLVPVDGRYLGTYHAYPNRGFEQGSAVIGLCRSKDLRHWEVDAPCLRPQDGAVWERGGLYKPCLVHYKETYYIFYNAKNDREGRWHEQTGVAISKDLKSWNRYTGNPVITNGPAGSVDEIFASDPCVLQDRNEWVLYYFGLDAKGVARDLAAISPDLLHTEKCNRILIDVGPQGSIDSTYAHKPTLVGHKGDLYHYYCAVHRDSGHEIRATSVARSRPWGKTASDCGTDQAISDSAARWPQARM